MGAGGAGTGWRGRGYERDFLLFVCLLSRAKRVEFLKIRLDLCTQWPCRLVVDRLCVMLSLGKDFRGEANKVLRIHGTLSDATLRST